MDRIPEWEGLSRGDAERGSIDGDQRLETGDDGRGSLGSIVYSLESAAVWSLPRSGGAGPDLSRESSRSETAQRGSAQARWVVVCSWLLVFRPATNDQPPTINQIRFVVAGL